MAVSAVHHSGRVANPLATLLSSPVQGGAKKADNDADDAASTKPVAPKLATSGAGQVLDRKV
jgi:hypothetical protein